jgi:hypothetical protein
VAFLLADPAAQIHLENRDHSREWMTHNMLAWFQSADHGRKFRLVR